MEFSYNYSDLMRSFVRPSFLNDGLCFLREAYPYRIMLQVDIGEEGTMEIPTVTRDKIMSLISQMGGIDNVKNSKVFFPMFVDISSRTPRGADAIIRTFMRDNYLRRLSKITTTNNEVYYGNSGIIFDKDWNLLFLSTLKIPLDFSFNAVTTVYFHPKVFTDDKKVLNKSLARKGVPFFLSNTEGVTRGTNQLVVKLEDPSKFIKVAEAPDINHCSQAEFSNILKENIDEVLKQITYDTRNRRR